MRQIDHFVLPVVDLAHIRDQLENIGFTIAPKGIHPFGTANVNLYLSDDVFLEFLAIDDQAKVDDAIRDANTFVRRDYLWRLRNGDNGFSAIVIASDDGLRDHQRFCDEDISAGALVDFTRPFALPDGSSDLASFRMVFAAPQQAQDVFFFSCQRLGVPNVDRQILERHGNGTNALKRIVMSAADPLIYQDFLERFFETEAQFDNNTLVLKTKNADLIVMKESDLKANYGVKIIGGGELRARGLVFSVADRAKLKQALQQSSKPDQYNDDNSEMPRQSVYAVNDALFFVFEDAD